MPRIDDVERGPPFALSVDGVEIAACSGETIAAAMLAAGLAVFRFDATGAPRGLWCNMGTCCECLVQLEDVGAVRACLVDAAPGQRIRRIARGGA